MTFMTTSRSAIVAFTVVEAKARFADCLRSAERGDPVLVTRHGKPVAAIVSAELMTEFERLRRASPAMGLAGVLGGWKGSQDLVTAVTSSRRTRPRRAPKLA